MQAIEQPRPLRDGPQPILEKTIRASTIRIQEWSLRRETARLETAPGSLADVVYDGSESMRAAVALGGAPDLSFEIERGWYRDAQAVRERAALVIATVPYPAGLSSASALSWGEGEQMSSLVEG